MFKKLFDFFKKFFKKEEPKEEIKRIELKIEEPKEPAGHCIHRRLRQLARQRRRASQHYNRD